ncbi:MAG: iron ABC transporter permease [Proteobacteria bacterium]|nr:MAG: iron ABC transporter permease [Pseudomonadota bacterium]
MRHKSHIMLVVLVLLFSLPFVALIGQMLSPDMPVWSHLWQTVLPTYLKNSLILAISVGFVSLFIGVLLAWLTASCEFPGRRYFDWLLVLPMAMPGYIVAYAYTWLLDVPGVLQSNLRSVTGWSYGDYYFPNIRSLSGAIIVLSLVLYPYVYLLCRAAFINQAKGLLEAHQLLGGGGLRFFRQVALPLARPAMFGGLALVLMETLADFGTVEYFGVNTLTTGILKSWFGMNSLSGAALIAMFLMVLVLLVVVIEKSLRGAAQFDEVHAAQQRSKRIQLHGWLAHVVVVFCGSVAFLGFILPLLLLGLMAIQAGSGFNFETLLTVSWQTFMLAGGCAVLIVLLALFMGHQQRSSRSKKLNATLHAMSLGYAIPGLVIAVGLSLALGWMDEIFNFMQTQLFGGREQLWLSGGFLALVMAYCIRFMAVAIQPIQAGFAGINHHFDEVSVLAGQSGFKRMTSIHMPLLKGSLLTALLLAFVDLLKELPATLVLRPFNFNTLAVKTYELASDERLAEAALPALCIVAVGLLPVILLNRQSGKSL